jgi:cyanophycin synthetase
MNIFNEHPFKVIFDYGHNAHAVQAMADLATRLDVQGRRIVVLSAPGDRRDEDILAIAQAVAGRFDHYICRRDDSLRGRGSDEVPNMLSSELQKSGVTPALIEIIPDEQEAIDRALSIAQQGDLLLVFADALTRSWKQITKFRAATVAAPAVRTPSVTPVEVSTAQEDVIHSGDIESAGFIRDERGVRYSKEAAD